MKVYVALPVVWGLQGAVASSYLRSWGIDDCTQFATSIREANASNTILNASYILEQTLNVSGVLNNVSFCRLFGEVGYAGNNAVNFELWLPASASYNSRFLVIGECNGGMAGTIAESDMVNGLNDGYAVAGGDAGHLASANNNGNGEPGVYLPSRRLWRSTPGPSILAQMCRCIPGFLFGSETEWAMQEGELADAFSIPILQNIVFNNLSYNDTDFNWGSDVDAVDDNVGVFIDEISANLSSLRQSGAKMILYQGWADPFNAAKWPIEHLYQIENFFGGDVSHWFRLFMVPGGGRCGSASNYPQVPGTWHALEALAKWVESGEPPLQILGTDPADENLSGKTSKLCPWPQNAIYQNGDPDDWGSYVCAD
ncbi:tannase and feruloyl esterase-domain-containing protein [Xylariaceae sp. FL0016]|nr:tannase and feruloyl esterase-domain-containing protein [Xylariaceae sp. FL0016]